MKRNVSQHTEREREREEAGMEKGGGRREWHSLS